MNWRHAIQWAIKANRERRNAAVSSDCRTSKADQQIYLEKDQMIDSKQLKKYSMNPLLKVSLMQNTIV
jgi:hypothetical protein